MTPEIDIEDVIASHGDDDPARFIAIADHFLRDDNLAAAAAALDRAYGIAPADPDLARHRTAILDALTVREHSIVWRYVPAGTFIMGSHSGERDERPPHPRRVDAFWIADAPLTWAQYNTFAGWPPPPATDPRDDDETNDADEATRDAWFYQAESGKIRWQYSIDDKDGDQPTYDRLPLVSVSPIEVEQLAARRSGERVRFALPSEAQWEKAARGGLVGKRYAWGDQPATLTRCDFGRAGDWRLTPPRDVPPNGYGLYAMCGGVAEWTADRYDALAYREGAPTSSPEATLRVVRGGSWTDCAEAVTVSFRSARDPNRPLTPNIGVRLVMTRAEGA